MRAASAATSCVLVLVVFGGGRAWRPAARTLRARVRMTSAYSGTPGDGRLGLEKLAPLLPLRAELTDGTQVEVAPFGGGPDDVRAGRALMNDVIRAGRAWPFEATFDDDASYSGYFLSHAAFVVRERATGVVAGAFYVKPNFPGRCSGVCNGGFITAPAFRRRGVGRLMGLAFLAFARGLGYRASYFNLVFKSNEPSVRLWDGLGFERVGEIRHCARLEGVDGLDTAYGYYFDLATLADEYDPIICFRDKSMPPRREV